MFIFFIIIFFYQLLYFSHFPSLCPSLSLQKIGFFMSWWRPPDVWYSPYRRPGLLSLAPGTLTGITSTPPPPRTWYSTHSKISSPCRYTTCLLLRGTWYSLKSSRYWLGLPDGGVVGVSLLQEVRLVLLGLLVLGGAASRPAGGSSCRNHACCYWWQWSHEIKKMALNEDAAVAVLLVITKIFIIAIKTATNRNIDNDMNMTTGNDQNVNDSYENHIMQILTMMKKNLRLP